MANFGIGGGSGVNGLGAPTPGSYAPDGSQISFGTGNPAAFASQQAQLQNAYGWTPQQYQSWASNPLNASQVVSDPAQWQQMQAQASPGQAVNDPAQSPPPASAGQASSFAQSVASKPYQAVGSANLGFGGGYDSSMSGSNPYLQAQGAAMLNQLNTNFQNNVLPAIDSGALASGNFGSSRQGVVQANALNSLNQNASNGLASLYGNGYNTALNYNLGQGQLQSNYALGMGGLANQAQANANNYNLGMNNNALGYANLDANINQNNVQNQLAGANFGLGLSNQSQQNAQTGINAGTNLQNTPYNYYNNFSNNANSIGQGYGTTSGTTSGTGSALTGALGGASLWNAWNRNNGGSTNYPGGSGWGADLGRG